VILTLKARDGAAPSPTREARALPSRKSKKVIAVNRPYLRRSTRSCSGQAPTAAKEDWQAALALQRQEFPSVQIRMTRGRKKFLKKVLASDVVL
jgi:hypothetical protein